MSKNHFRLRYIFVPYTPAGTPLFHLKSNTRQEAIDKLLKDAAHKTWENFSHRGYTIQKLYDPAQGRK